MTSNNEQEIDNFWLSIDDAIVETAKRLYEKVKSGDQRSRNLKIIRQGYEDYLATATEWKQFPVPGIPIVLKDGDFHFDRMLLHTKLFTRAFFEDRPKGGTEIVYTSQHRGGQGFQWYIVSWQIQHNLLTVWATHWMIHRDEEMRRNTVYFTRGFSFTETEGFGTDGFRMFSDWIAVSKVPDKHRRTVKQAYEHALRFDKKKDEIEGWVTVINPYGSFELIFKLDSMFRSFDMGEHKKWYLNHEFKQFWNLRVLESVWGKDWTSKKFDKDGILKELWYYPDTTHFMDKERFESIYDDWTVVRGKYEEWIRQFRFPPHLQAPQDDEKHLLKLDTQPPQPPADVT
jgi:hypothetical protein